MTLEAQEAIINYMIKKDSSTSIKEYLVEKNFYEELEKETNKMRVLEIITKHTKTKK